MTTLLESRNQCFFSKDDLVWLTGAVCRAIGSVSKIGLHLVAFEVSFQKKKKELYPILLPQLLKVLSCVVVGSYRWEGGPTARTCDEVQSACACGVKKQ